MAAPPTDPDLLGFLVGTWRGAGVGGYPTIEDFRYGEEITFSRTSTPVLAYSARAWRLDPDGNPAAASHAEIGWWRPQPAGRLEVLVAHPTGVAEIYVGTVAGTRIEMATDVVACTETAKDVTGGRRMYGIVDGALMYAIDLAALGHPLAPHVSARLQRS